MSIRARNGPVPGPARRLARRGHADRRDRVGATSASAVETGVAEARLALGLVDEGLNVAAEVADEVDRALLSLGNLLRLVLVLAVIGLIIAALRKARQAR